MSETDLLPSTNTPPEVSAATTLIPYRKDDDKARYLGYMACGFSDEEALFVLGRTVGWLEEARQDSRFADLENRIPEIRKELSKEYTELDFYRNFRMVLAKDHLVLRKSLGMVKDEDTGEPAELSLYEQQYLLRLRSAYTPQQLQLLEVVVSGSGDGFNFAKWIADPQNMEVIRLSRTDSITVGARSASKEENDS